MGCLLMNKVKNNIDLNQEKGNLKNIGYKKIRKSRNKYH
jgi:hypothetical protein